MAVGHGGDRATRNNFALKDVSEAIGESERMTQRLIKLNDLIPQLQSLVSSGKLGTLAAEQVEFFNALYLDKVFVLSKT